MTIILLVIPEFEILRTALGRRVRIQSLIRYIQGRVEHALRQADQP